MAAFLGAIASMRGDHDRAGRLLAAFDAGHVGMRAFVGALIEHHGAVVRVAMDDDSFERLSAEGRAMPIDQAIAYGLEFTDI